MTEAPTNLTTFFYDARATVAVTGGASDLSSISCTSNLASTSYYAVLDVEPTNDAGLGHANVCYLTGAVVASDSLTECAVAQLKNNETSLYHALGTADSYVAFVNSNKIFIRATTPATVGTPVSPAACLASVHCATADGAAKTCLVGGSTSLKASSSATVSPVTV